MQVIPTRQVGVLQDEPLQHHRLLDAPAKHTEAQPVGLEAAQLEDLNLFGYLEVVLEELEEVDVLDVVLAELGLFPLGSKALRDLDVLVPLFKLLEVYLVGPELHGLEACEVSQDAAKYLRFRFLNQIKVEFDFDSWNLLAHEILLGKFNVPLRVDRPPSIPLVGCHLDLHIDWYVLLL